MSYRFKRSSPRQHALVGGLVGLALAVAHTEAFARAWAAWVQSFSDRTLLVGGAFILHALVFWPLALAFHRVDVTGRPGCIARHRIQPDGRKHPPLGRTIRVLLRNQLLYLPLLLWGLAELLIWRGWQAEPGLPSLPRFVFEMIGQGACALVVFYASHRFLHRKWWMKRVHRVHHEFKTTTALASEYAHPVEFAAGNFATLATGALLLMPHLASIYLFTVLSIITIVVHHAGYALPWAPYAAPHDWHHYRVRELFGTVGLLDRLLGTDQEFRTLEDGDQR